MVGPLDAAYAAQQRGSLSGRCTARRFERKIELGIFAAVSGCSPIRRTITQTTRRPSSAGFANTTSERDATDGGTTKTLSVNGRGHLLTKKRTLRSERSLRLGVEPTNEMRRALRRSTVCMSTTGTEASAISVIAESVARRSTWTTLSHYRRAEPIHMTTSVSPIRDATSRDTTAGSPPSCSLSARHEQGREVQRAA
jgi:hypothetical protein